MSRLPALDGSFGRACPDDRVQLVDEEDDPAVRGLDLVEHSLEPLLELAPVLRARDEGADVEGPHALALQSFRDVAGGDALREPFGDGRLPDAGIADQHRVVLRAPRENLDHAPDLLVAPDDGVELALLRRGCEVAAELFEGLVSLLGVLRRDALPATNGLDLRLELVARDDVERKEQVLGRDIVVLHATCLVGGVVEHARERRRDVRLLLHALHRRLRAERSLGLSAKLSRVRHELLRELLVEEREQQMLRVELGIAHAACKLLRCRNSFLAFECQLVEVQLGPFPLLRVGISSMGGFQGTRSRR